MELTQDRAPPLAGREIHGFYTVADLDIERLMKEGQSRWFRPNEVHAILSNSHHFKILPQTVDKPKSGTVLLFDRKVLRNFRRDGYNWRKKKDGKNVQEAHEKLKVGDEERVHVYYARSDEDPHFYRRSYWLLDKDLERIVLVHYRQTSEDSVFPNPSLAVERTDPTSYDNTRNYSSPVTPLNSTSASAHSDLSGSAGLSEEINSEVEQAIYAGSALYPVNEQSQYQNNEFDWGDFEEPYIGIGSHGQGFIPSLGQDLQNESPNNPHNVGFLSSQGISSSEYSREAVNSNGYDGVKQVTTGNFQTVEGHERVSHHVHPDCQVMDVQSTLVGRSEVSRIVADDILVSQDSFGRWNYVNDEALQSDCHPITAPISSGNRSDAYCDNVYKEEPIFNILDISPEWAYSTVETKVVVIGFFKESYKHLSRSKLFSVFGEACIATEMIQDGVYRCTVLAYVPGLVNFFLTLDGDTPISQVLSFEFRSLPGVQPNGGLNSFEESAHKLKKTLNLARLRLSHLLFSTTNTISILSNKIQPKCLKEAKKYESFASSLVEKDWMSLKLQRDSEISVVEDLFELVLKNKVQEWLLHKVAEGSKIIPLDSQGQGVIHLCAILDYAWAVRLFSFSGISLDFRDASGWTALHWAAHLGREKMVAALLAAGANPSLVTDPTLKTPGGFTAADLASEGGYEGLAAYLAEKGLTAHIKAMTLSGNMTASAKMTSNNMATSQYSENLSEQELCLKESLAAYRNAAEAASCIQAAFRERSLKQQTKAVQLANPVMEASQIVAALKIQHAFRNYNRVRLMKAAARIQTHFRTWQTRKQFLNMRRQVIKIQAVFRGHQTRKQYFKLMWSVGVLEKAILRWRLKRKGLRGMQTETTQAMKVDQEQEEDVAEEDFFRIGREQAEERVTNSVVKVQAMFRSYRAQQEYRRMKLAHENAKLEFDSDDET